MASWSANNDLVPSNWNVVKSTYGEANRQVVADPIAFNSRAIRVFYPAGSRNPAAAPRNPVGGTGFYARPLDLSRATCVQLQYEVLFPAGFQFVKGGKLPGLYGGFEGCSGGEKGACFSTRYMWRTGGLGELYPYLPQKSQVPALYKIPPLSIAHPDDGVSLGRGSFRFTTGRWTQLTQIVTLNTPGKPDGKVRVLVKEDSDAPQFEAISFDRVVWRKARSVGFVGIQFETFFGGSDDSWSTPKDQTTFFRNISVNVVA